MLGAFTGLGVEIGVFPLWYLLGGSYWGGVGVWVVWSTLAGAGREFIL